MTDARARLAELNHRLSSFGNRSDGTFISLADPNSITDPLAEGRLHGMTIGVKDNIHVAGMPNTAGTESMERFAPTTDAPVVGRLRAEGALIAGKTNMHEMAFGITSNNFHSGPVRNPHDPTRFAGGSSGGSAAAVAAGLVDAAIGSDTGGSMRIPAALCGIIGYRPSVGRYPSEGMVPISTTRDVPGPMAMEMRTIALLDSVMASRPPVARPANLDGLALGIARRPFFDDLDPETERLMTLALRRLAEAGVRLVEADLEELAELTEKSSFAIALYEHVEALPRYLRRYGVGVDFFELARRTKSPDVRSLYASMAVDNDADGKPDGVIPEAAYRTAIDELRPRMIALYQAYFLEHDIDALVFPTTILPAAPIADTTETVTHNGREAPVFQTYIRNTDPGSTAGLPGLSLPIGVTATRLPVGMGIDVLPGDDEALLAIGLALEDIVAGQAPDERP